MPEAPRDSNRIEAIVMDLVSHELRSPLTAIRGYAETLLRRVGRLPLKDQEEFLHNILQSTTRLEYRLDQMLDLAELRAGRVSPPSEHVDMANAIRAAIEVACGRPRLETYGDATMEDAPLPPPTIALHLISDETAETPPAQAESDALAFPVLGDARRLHDVLLHVLANALRHSPPGNTVEVQVRSIARCDAFAEAAARGTLGLEDSVRASQVRSERESGVNSGTGSLSQLPPAPRVIEIAINDAGAGIAPEHLERIFEPFYQVDQQLSRGVEGLGLGLPICREVIHLHDGLIWAESAPGDGTSIRILLPRREPEPSTSRRKRR